MFYVAISCAIAHIIERPRFNSCDRDEAVHYHHVQLQSSQLHRSSPHRVIKFRQEISNRFSYWLHLTLDAPLSNLK